MIVLEVEDDEGRMVSLYNFTWNYIWPPIGSILDTKWKFVFIVFFCFFGNTKHTCYSLVSSSTSNMAHLPSMVNIIIPVWTWSVTDGAEEDEWYLLPSNFTLPMTTCFFKAFCHNYSQLLSAEGRTIDWCNYYLLVTSRTSKTTGQIVSNWLKGIGSRSGVDMYPRNNSS